MNTVETWQIESASSEYTEQLAERIGKNLKGNETIELISDLGGGKTTFTRGLVRGAGSTDKVTSPTFTISKVYDTPDYAIHHFDFYRLSEAGVVAMELAEVRDDAHAVAVIEWADSVVHVLPQERLTVVIRQTPSGSRLITFQYTASLQYLFEGLTQ